MSAIYSNEHIWRSFFQKFFEMLKIIIDTKYCCDEMSAERDTLFPFGAGRWSFIALSARQSRVCPWESGETGDYRVNAMGQSEELGDSVTQLTTVDSLWWSYQACEQHYTLMICTLNVKRHVSKWRWELTCTFTEVDIKARFFGQTV